MEPYNRLHEPFWERIGAKYPQRGGYFFSHCPGFCSLKDIPPGKLEPYGHEYRFRSPNSQSMKAETVFETGKGSFNAGPLVSAT